MKKCGRCKKRRRSDKFHKDKTRHDGLGYWCKDCIKKHHPVRRKRERERYANDPEFRRKKLESVKRYGSSVAGRNTNDRACKKYRSTPRGKVIKAVHLITSTAMRIGALIRPDECSSCHKKCKPQAHHTDYMKPLDVAWLCPKCHKREHLTKKF